jgi:hypothetical protein
LDLRAEIGKGRIIEDREQAVEWIGEVRRHEGGQKLRARFAWREVPSRSAACCHASSIRALSAAGQVKAKEPWTW